MHPVCNRSSLTQKAQEVRLIYGMLDCREVCPRARSPALACLCPPITMDFPHAAYERSIGVAKGKDSDWALAEAHHMGADLMWLGTGFGSRMDHADDLLILQELMNAVTAEDQISVLWVQLPLHNLRVRDDAHSRRNLVAE